MSTRSAPVPTRLIVNADDLGQDAHRDRSILALFAAGALSSASLVVNGLRAGEAAAAAVAAGLPLGLHLNLGDGQALTGASSLTDANGYLPGKHGLRTVLHAGRIRSQDIQREIAAQIDHFCTLTGRPPDHIDGHHHCHVALPVAEALIPEMRCAGLDRIRLPKATDDVEPATAIEGRFADSPRCLDFYRQIRTEVAQVEPLYRQAGIGFPDRFCGIALMGRAMTPDRLLVMLQNIAASGVASAELMCHPGHPAPFAIAPHSFADSPERRLESATLRQLLERTADKHWPCGLIPASFGELPRPCER